MGASDKKAKNLSYWIGYLIAYFILTIAIYYVLIFFKLLPSEWGFLHIALLVSAVTLSAILTKRVLK